MSGVFRYPEPVAKTPLERYLVLQRALDRDVLAALRASASNIEAELRRLQARSGIGAAVRREQLVHSQVVIHNEMARYWAGVGDTVEAARATAAAEGAQTILDGSRDGLSQVFSAAELTYMTESTRQQAARGVEVLQERLSGSSHVPLAQSVYDNAALTNGHVDEIINNALARGASAADLAKDVRGFINPNTPGGVRYASMRLGRTELNNAFHANQVRQAQAQPWTTGVKWNLSGSHPTPDECNDYADQEHIKGEAAGVFRPNEVPAKPHPNCLCYLTNEDVGRDEFVNQFFNGQYNEYLEERYPDLADALPTKSVAAPTPTLPPSIQKLPRSNPMSIEDALRGSNPRFHESIDYTINCQKTSAAYEMRRRGFEVAAKPKMGSFTSTAARWEGSNGRAPATRLAKSAEDMLAKTSSHPVGARYMVECEWNRGGFHIFNAEKMTDGSIRFVDAQTGRINTDHYWRRMKEGTVKFYRVDDTNPRSVISSMLTKEN